MNRIQKATARVLPLLLVLAAGIGPVLAQTPRFVPGNVNRAQTTKLTSEIHWYQNLSMAEAQARKEGKLVFWMHMLGQLDGAT